MDDAVTFSTPAGTMTPIGPYSHLACAGPLVVIGAIAGIDPRTGQLAGAGVAAQTDAILKQFETMLAAAGSDLDHVLHVTAFLRDMDDYAAMNDAYAAFLGDRRPARSVVAVSDLPKPGARVTMNLMAWRAVAPP